MKQSVWDMNFEDPIAKCYSDFKKKKKIHNESNGWKPGKQ